MLIAEGGAGDDEKDGHTRKLVRGGQPESRIVAHRIGHPRRTHLERNHRLPRARQTVKLSSFGSFVVRKKGQRIGRNFKTAKEVPISPRRVMVFKPSAILKQCINADSSARK